MPALIQFNSCDTCSLKAEWPNLQTPRMPMALPTQRAPYQVMLIGEGPGETEDREGRPFVGKSGKFLREYLPFEWKDKVYWQNCVRCRPPKNRAPTTREVSCCSQYLKKDILAARPQAILGIGAEALAYFWPDKPGTTADNVPTISKMRGIPFPVVIEDFTTWFYPIFHPSYVMRAERENYSDGSVVNTVLPVFRNDIKNFFNRLHEFSVPPVISVPTKAILYPKTFEEFVALFQRLRAPYAIDIETFKLKPYERDARLLTAACSDGVTTFAWSVNHPKAINDWGLKALIYLMESDKEWIAQHASFELIWIWAKTGVLPRTLHDTEVIARLLHKRKGVGSLDVLSRVYFGMDIKKVTDSALAGQMLGPLDKTRIAEYSVEQILEYNALDAWIEALTFYKLWAVLPEEQKGNYYRTIATIKSTVAMELHGLPVSLAESEKQQKELYAKMQAYEKQAAALPEVKAFEKLEQKIFSLSTPQSVASVLTKYCHIALEKTDKNNYSIDEEVLEKIVDLHPLIPLRLDFVEVQKLNSTYVKPILTGRILGADGLVHGAYTVVQTATYRLSSFDPNMQNWPKRKNKEIRRQIIAPPGFIFAAFDYGQLEARTLVMASKDETLRMSFINKDDIHKKWLNRLLEIYPAYLNRLSDKTGQTEESKIREAGRDIIKTDFVFASFYGSIAKSIANRAMLPMEIAIQLLGEFWREYAGVKRWIDGQFAEYKETGTVRSLTARIRDEVIGGNEPINTPIQGTAAEMVLEAQNALYEKAINEDDNFLPRINIHDDLLFLFPDDSNLDKYIQVTAEEIVKPRFDFVNLPLMTECRIGYNWADLIPVQKFEGKSYKDFYAPTVHLS